jgi:RND family efflux transporter MFP subunit
VLSPPLADATAPIEELAAKPRAVQVDSVQSEPLRLKRRALGETRASKELKAAFEVPGRVTERPVEVGQRVKAGDLVARLDAEGYENGQRAAKAEVARWKAQRDQSARDKRRAESLQSQGVLTAAQAEAASTGTEALDAAVRAASVQVSETERLVSKTEVRAPFDAIVAAVLVEPGEVVAAGTPVAILHAVGSVEVTVELPEDWASQVSVGQTVSARLPLFGPEDRPGKVTELSPAAGPGRLFAVRVEIPMPEGLSAGVAAEVQFERDAGEVLTVPLAAIADPSGTRPWVYRLRDNTVERARLVPGRPVGERVEVLEGLAAGDRVVVSHLMALLPGDAVEVLP